MPNDVTQFRRDFWTMYAGLYPDDGVPSGWGRSHVWVPVESADFHVSLRVLRWGTGVWLRGRKLESRKEAEPRVGPLRESFRRAIGDAFDELSLSDPVTMWDEAGEFDALRDFDVADPENWQHMATWLHYMLQMYLRIIENSQVKN